LRNPATARGTAMIPGYTIVFDLRSASLAGLQAAGTAIPVQGTLGWSGARAAVDGNVAPDGARLDADVQVSADDASELLAALGVAAHEPGRLEGRGRVGVTAADAAVTDLALTLGKSALSGRRGSGVHACAIDRRHSDAWTWTHSSPPRHGDGQDNCESFVDVSKVQRR
jgi:hypothetical protein